MKFSSIILLLFVTPAKSENETGISAMNPEYGVVAYECDADLHMLGEDDRQEKKTGSVYQLCMEPNQAAKDAGVSIGKLESWDWRTVSQGEKVHFQPVADGIEAAPGLSLFNCLDKGNLCVFNSFLTSDFYKDPGTVTGNGNVILTGGAGSVPVELDLFLHRFKVKVDPELQEYLDNMRDNALGDGEL